jgi:hypothetical protein
VLQFCVVHCGACDPAVISQMKARQKEEKKRKKEET